MYIFLSLFLLLQNSTLAGTNCNRIAELNQIELNECSRVERDNSFSDLKPALRKNTFNNWKELSLDICSQVWERYRKGSIYSLAISKCQTDINRSLIKQNSHGMKGY